MSAPPASYDGPWKELLDQHLPEALAFFAEDVYAEIDWRKDWQAVEQEFRRLTGESETGTRLADKVILYQSIAGEPSVLHSEVQGQPEGGLPRRGYVYGYRLDDRYGVPADLLVILADDDPDYRPTCYLAEKTRSKLTLEFRPVKILDYAGREEWLLSHENPVGLFVQAHLWSRQTRKDEGARLERKLQLIARLASRTLEPGEMRHWYRYLDWLMPLSADYRAEYHRRLNLLEEAEKMPFVSDLEQWAIDRAAEKAEENARTRVAAAEKAAAEKAAEKLIESLSLIEGLKFGTDELRAALTGRPPEVIDEVLKAIGTAGSLADLKKLIP